MAVKAITTLLADHSEGIYNPEIPTAIEVRDIVMDFNSASQQLNSFKEYFIALARGELMFKRFRALDGVSLKVQKGDVYGILGTNGSGKSTLLKIVSGVLEPTEGTVDIQGKIAPLIEMGAGFDYELTARENIYLNGALLGYPRAFIDEHFDAIVDFAEIRDFLDMPLKNYSSGMVSRIAFAIATVIVPEILIVDEVLAVGDFMFRQKCEQRIQSLINEHGTTVLIVSHSSEQIERLCNKAIWIEKGHVRMVGEAREVSQAYQAFGGHQGSLEAEGVIFDYINSKTRPRIDILESLAGNNRFATNVLVANKIHAQQPVHTIVLASGRDTGVYMNAVSVAGRLSGIAMMIEPQEIPDSTLLALASIAPQRLVVLTKGEQSDLVSSARATVGRDCNIQAISYKNADQLSLDLEELVLNPDQSTPDAEALDDGSLPILVVGSSQGAAIATLAPLLALGAPFFSATSKAQVPALASHLATKTDRTIALIGHENDAVLDNLAEQLAAKNVETVRINDAASDESSEKAMRFWMEQLALNKANEDLDRTLYLTTQEGLVDALSIAPLVALNHGTVLATNHNNMDSMARALDYISKRKETLERLVVVGSNVCFTNVDRTIMAKAAALQ